MKYIQKFQTVAEYNAANIERPNVSYIVETEELKFLRDDILNIGEQAVKDILVANFDTDGDGEISIDEALAVTQPFGSLFKQAGVHDLTCLKYFKNVEYAGNMDMQFYYNPGDGGSAGIRYASFDDCKFSRATILSSFLGNHPLINASFRNCDFRNCTSFYQFLKSSATTAHVFDFSGSKWTEFSQITSCSNFFYAATTVKVLMDGCDQTSLDTMKEILRNNYMNKYSGKITIDIDGTRWTLSGESPNQAWTSSEIVE